MEITLRNLVNEQEVRAIIEEAVDAILDRSISFAVLPSEGDALAIDAAFDNRLIAAKNVEMFECEVCGQTGFASKAALGGHKYWKHGVAKDSKSTPEELKDESRARQTARWAAAPEDKS